MKTFQPIYGELWHCSAVSPLLQTLSFNPQNSTVGLASTYLNVSIPSLVSSRVRLEAQLSWYGHVSGGLEAAAAPLVPLLINLTVAEATTNDNYPVDKSLVVSAGGYTVGMLECFTNLPLKIPFYRTLFPSLWIPTSLSSLPDNLLLLPKHERIDQQRSFRWPRLGWKPFRDCEMFWMKCDSSGICTAQFKHGVIGRAIECSFYKPIYFCLKGLVKDLPLTHIHCVKLNINMNARQRKWKHNIDTSFGSTYSR